MPHFPTGTMCMAACETKPQENVCGLSTHSRGPAGYSFTVSLGFQEPKLEDYKHFSHCTEMMHFRRCHGAANGRIEAFMYSAWPSSNVVLVFVRAVRANVVSAHPGRDVTPVPVNFHTTPDVNKT